MNRLQIRSRRYTLVILFLGSALHVGSALLRLGTFFPYPQLIDFAAFYVAASAVRHGMSPYGLPDTWVESLRAASGVSFAIPPVFNPPLWPWLLQPLTLMPYPLAAWSWVVLGLTVLLSSSFALMRLANRRGWKAWGLTFLLTTTFGPVFLDLTIGQTSILLLAMCLVAGFSLRAKEDRNQWRGVLAIGVATAAKLFPAIWLGAPALLRRVKWLGLGIAAVVIVVALGFLASPAGSQQYWSTFLAERVAAASEEAGMDDQSLVAWLKRLGGTHTYHVPGLRVEDRLTITWKAPWPVPDRTLRSAGYLLLGILFLPTACALLRATPENADGAFYLWVLYTLIALPHIERYNHTLLLPAMAWLWGRGERYQLVAAGAYGLAGLSRLNHLWISILPSPWGPLASGFGLYAVLLLGAGLTSALWRRPFVSA